MAKIFEEKLEVYDCESCLFYNYVEGDYVECDKKLLLEGEIIYTTNTNDSACHSHFEIIDVRNDKDLRKSKNSCSYCGRVLNLDDKESYTLSPEDVIRKCIICEEKGRKLYM